MNDTLLDDQYGSDPADWDGKTRIAAGDAITEINSHGSNLRKFRWAMIALLLVNIFLSLVTVAYVAGYSSSLIVALLLVLLILAPIILAVIFFNRNPVLWLAIAGGGYLLTLAIEAYLGLAQQGWIGKLFILTAFGYGIYAALEWRKNINILRKLDYPRQQLAEAERKLTGLPRLPKKRAR